MVAPVEALIADYRRYLLEERGLSELSSVRHYLNVAVGFLSHRPIGDLAELQRLTAADVTGFVLSARRRRTVGDAKSISTRLRSFLRYLELAGLTSNGLAGAVPSMASWELTGLPRAVSPAADVEAWKVKALSAKYANSRRSAAHKIAVAEQLADQARLAAAAVPVPELKANTTDPESRIMKTAAGWVQGFNAQAAVNAGQVVIAAAVTQDNNDSQQLTPMMNAVQSNADMAALCGPVGVVLADAGYWSDKNASAEGPDRLIATTKDWKQRRKARELGLTEDPPPVGASQLDAMEHRLRTLEGATLYKLRSHTVEPVFGQIKENRGIRRFMRRGHTAAPSEWSLICTTNNILKLFTRANGHTLASITT